jgi:phage tail-like protein
MAYLDDPLRGFKFIVSIPNMLDEADPTNMGFMKVGSLEADIGVIEWQEISDPITVTKLPDRIKFKDVVLERGVGFRRSAMFNWFLFVKYALDSGVPADFRRTVEITTVAKGSAPGRIWRVYSAWPKTMTFAELDATQSVIQVESVTLANEGYELIS